MLKSILSKPIYSIIVIPALISVILVFFEPSISSVREGLFNFVGFISNTWRDRVYYHANKNPELGVAMITFEIVSLAIILTFTGSWVILSRKSYDIAKVISGEKQNTHPYSGDKLKVAEKIRSTTKKLILCNLTATLVTASMFLLIYTGFATSINLKTNFQNRFKAIEVGIDEKEHKTILSKWALVKDKKSYDDIMSNMKDISDRYKLEIPDIF